MITGSMMSSNFYPSPTLFYPPPPSTEYFPHTGAHCVRYTPSPEPAPFSRPPPPTQQRSRKRSRDQAEDDDREAAFQAANVMDTSVEETEPEPIYGEGMVLINPRTGRPVGNGASSGTGTWCEEQVEEDCRASKAAAEQMKRDQEEMAKAINRPAKAQRIDLAGLHSTRSGSPSTAPGMVAPAPLTPVTPSSPVIDEAAMMLGVGWRKVEGSDDSALISASRGWARFIDNHFANLSNAQILAKSAGKEAFLVSAHDMSIGSSGYFLFSESLEQGQLLACDIPSAITNFHSGAFAGQLMTTRKSATPEMSATRGLPTPAVEVAMEL